MAAGIIPSHRVMMIDGGQVIIPLQGSREGFLESSLSLASSHIIAVSERLSRQSSIVRHAFGSSEE